MGYTRLWGESDPSIAYGCKALLTAYLILAGLWDLKIERGTVPNWLTLPALGMVALIRFTPAKEYLPAGWMETLLAWGIIILLWTLNVYGAGDAKFLMVQFGLFPTLPFATLMAICIILLQTPILIWRKGILRFGRETFSRLATLRIFPTREEFEEGKEPSTWIFVPAGIIYIWLFW